MTFPGTVPGVADLRHRVDTAAVHLELLPAHATQLGAEDRGHHDANESPPATQAAAVYAVTRLVTLASYESCSGIEPPAVRYLRRDARGRIMMDVMLHHDEKNSAK